MSIKRINQFEPWFDDEEVKEVTDTIKSGWIAEGKKTKEFEKKYAEFLNAKHAVATTSGSMALYLALLAEDVGPSDEVIVPDLTFVASPNSVVMAGGKVSLIDIEEHDLCLTVKHVEKMISKKTKGIMPVDFNGRCPDLILLQEIAKRHGLFVVEDSCHGIGSYYNDKHTGYFSDIGIFSFSTPKIITTGQGGMIVTDDQDLYNSCRMLKDFGRDVDKKHDMKSAFDHVTIGFNFKLTEFQAAIGIAQMKKLPKRILRKKKIYSMYMEQLSDAKGIEFIETDLDNITPWFNDVLLPDRKTRDKLIDHLGDLSIGTRMFYPPIHKLRAYSDLSGKFRNSISMSDRGLWLPSSSFLTDDDVTTVCDRITRFMNSS